MNWLIISHTNTVFHWHPKNKGFDYHFITLDELKNRSYTLTPIETTYLQFWNTQDELILWFLTFLLFIYLLIWFRVFRVSTSTDSTTSVKVYDLEGRTDKMDDFLESPFRSPCGFFSYLNKIINKSVFDTTILLKTSFLRSIDIVVGRRSYKVRLMGRFSTGPQSSNRIFEDHEVIWKYVYISVLRCI